MPSLAKAYIATIAAVATAVLAVVPFDGTPKTSYAFSCSLRWRWWPPR